MSDREGDPQTATWHFDRRLPVALIVALTVQAGSSLWWAASFSARTETRLESGEKRMALFEDILRKLADSQNQVSSAVAVQAETQKQIIAITVRLEGRVDTFLRPQGGR
jgi:hypothetical protein